MDSVIDMLDVCLPIVGQEFQCYIRQTQELIASKGFSSQFISLMSPELPTKSPPKSPVAEICLICIKSKWPPTRGVKFQSCSYLVKNQYQYIPLIIRNQKKYSLTHVRCIVFKLQAKGSSIKFQVYFQLYRHSGDRFSTSQQQTPSIPSLN